MRERLPLPGSIGKNSSPQIAATSIQSWHHAEVCTAVASYIRQWRTHLGVLKAHPAAFIIVFCYVGAWLIFSFRTFEWHAAATVATWLMTLIIQRAEHRATQAIQATNCFGPTERRGMNSSRRMSRSRKPSNSIAQRNVTLKNSQVGPFERLLPFSMILGLLQSRNGGRFVRKHRCAPARSASAIGEAPIAALAFFSQSRRGAALAGGQHAVIPSGYLCRPREQLSRADDRGR